MKSPGFGWGRYVALEACCFSMEKIRWKFRRRVFFCVSLSKSQLCLARNQRQRNLDFFRISSSSWSQVSFCSSNSPLNNMSRSWRSVPWRQVSSLLGTFFPASLAAKWKSLPRKCEWLFWSRLGRVGYLLPQRHSPPVPRLLAGNEGSQYQFRSSPQEDAGLETADKPRVQLRWVFQTSKSKSSLREST